MIRKSILAMSALTLGLALMFAVAVKSSTKAAAAGPDPQQVKIQFGTVAGTINLPQTLPAGLSSLPCSSLRVGMYRYTSGDPIGVQTAGPVTPQPSGPGKCSYSLSALATGWSSISVGYATANQWDLAQQVSPSQNVTVQPNQTATRNITITQVTAYKPF